MCSIRLPAIHHVGCFTKYFFIATEDWRTGVSDRHTYLCNDNPSEKVQGCGPNGAKQGPINTSIYNSQVPLSWHVQFSGGHVTYCGRLDNKTGCGPGYFAFMDPMYKGQVIRPNMPQIIGPKGKADDPSRVRTDGLGMPDFGMPVAIAE